MAQKACGTGAAIDSSAQHIKGRDVGHVYGLSAKQKDDPQCPPGMGNEVGSGVLHLNGAFLAIAFNRRKADVPGYARHAEKSCGHMDTCRQARFCVTHNRLLQPRASQGNTFHYTDKVEKNNNTVHKSS